MKFEGGAAGPGQFRRGAGSLADEGFAYLDIARLFEGGELLGQGGVGQGEAVADEFELTWTWPATAAKMRRRRAGQLGGGR
jgi:hypothetical protein